MTILHIYSNNSPIYFDIMFICNKWQIKKNWYYQSFKETVSFILENNQVNQFVCDLVLCSYDLQNDEITIEISKDDKPLIYTFLTINPFKTIIQYLSYIKDIDRSRIDTIYKQTLISNTKNHITQSFPTEIVNHIVSFI